MRAVLIRIMLMLVAPVLIATALFAPAASAAEWPAGPVRLEAAMTVTGFDAATAARNGYPTTAPAGIAGGTCGSSYLFLDPLPRTVRIRTGFSLADNMPPAVGVTWTVDVNGPNGTGFVKPFNPPYAGPMRTWDGVDVQTHVGPGVYEGLVIAPSFATLTNGDVCTSNYPTAKTSIP